MINFIRMWFMLKCGFNSALSQYWHSWGGRQVRKRNDLNSVIHFLPNPLQAYFFHNVFARSSWLVFLFILFQIRHLFPFNFIKFICSSFLAGFGLFVRRHLADVVWTELHMLVCSTKTTNCHKKYEEI